jgi:hypothetical protein
MSFAGGRVILQKGKGELRRTKFNKIYPVLNIVRKCPERKQNKGNLWGETCIAEQVSGFN